MNDVSNRAVRARNRLEVAERRAAVSTLRFRAAQEQLGRTLTRTSRIARVASGTLAALGGPVGAILTAVSLGATAWALWGRNAEQASQTALEELREVEEAARAGTASLERQSRALLAQSEIQRRALTEQIALERGRLQRLQAPANLDISGQMQRRAQVQGTQERIEALTMERRALSDQIRGTRAALNQLSTQNNAIAMSTDAVTASVSGLGDTVRRERASIESLLALRPVQVPDIEGQQNRARDVVRELRDQIAGEQRRQEQLRETVTLRGQELVATQRSQDALNDFADRQRQATRDQLDALSQLGCSECRTCGS